MFRIEFVIHRNISDQQLIDIVNVKSKQWNYEKKSQLAWIKDNIKNSDIHVLLYKQNDQIAYLNLIDIEIALNGNKMKAYGVGNVCAVEKGKGYGLELMRNVNTYILNLAKVGILFCKEDLLNFYIKTGWIVLEQKNIDIKNNNDFVMFYGYPSKENVLIEYSDIRF